MHVPGVVAPAFRPQEQCLAEHQPHSAEQGQAWIGQATNRDAIEPIDRRCGPRATHGAITVTRWPRWRRPFASVRTCNSMPPPLGGGYAPPQQHEDVQCNPACRQAAWVGSCTFMAVHRRRCAAPVEPTLEGGGCRAGARGNGRRRPRWRPPGQAPRDAARRAPVRAGQARP
jgi:hypothetical protein